MAWGNKYGRAFVDPARPAAFGSCDVCGIQWNLNRLQWQFQFNGTGLYNRRILACPRCLDKPSPFLLTPILPPDPRPVLNARPEPYAIDEAGAQYLQALINGNDLSTIDLGWGDLSLAWDAETFVWDGVVDELSVFYIDLYNYDPDVGGVSILQTITGSATRTNYLSSMGAPDPATGDVANTVPIVITSSAVSSAFCSYICIFDAATNGTLLMKAPLAISQTIVQDNSCTFDIGDLVVMLQTSFFMLTEDGDFMVTEDGDFMVTEPV